LKFQDQKTNANSQLSLYKVTIRFGISSGIALEEKEWDEIWKIWEKAVGLLSTGKA
jgi:CRISPR-associated protein Cmr6